MTCALIVLAVILLSVCGFSAVVILGIAWTHYPYGIPRKREKHKP